jgi:Holliday junction resolvase RusA-like endonuclease
MKYELACEFTLLVDPKPKARPSFTRAGRVYTPSETKSFEKLVADTLHYAFKQTPIDGRPLIVELEFHIERPKSVKRDYPIVKPDIDNFVKAILDAANGVIYKDDAVICDLHVKKRYAETGYIRLKVSYLDCVMIGQTITI